MQSATVVTVVISYAVSCSRSICGLLEQQLEQKWQPAACSTVVAALQQPQKQQQRCNTVATKALYRCYSSDKNSAVTVVAVTAS
jgi:hypothetical protein